MKYYFLITAIICTLTSCENTWDQEGRDAFKQACMEDARSQHMSDEKAKTMCDCRLETVMKKYPRMGDALEHMSDIANDPDMKKCGQ